MDQGYQCLTDSVTLDISSVINANQYFDFNDSEDNIHDSIFQRTIVGNPHDYFDSMDATTDNAEFKTPRKAFGDRSNYTPHLTRSMCKKFNSRTVSHGNVTQSGAPNLDERVESPASPVLKSVLQPKSSDISTIEVPIVKRTPSCGGIPTAKPCSNTNEHKADLKVEKAKLHDANLDFSTQLENLKIEPQTILQESINNVPSSTSKSTVRIADKPATPFANKKLVTSPVNKPKFQGKPMRSSFTSKVDRRPGKGQTHSTTHAKSENQTSFSPSRGLANLIDSNGNNRGARFNLERLMTATKASSLKARTPSVEKVILIKNVAPEGSKKHLRASTGPKLTSCLSTVSSLHGCPTSGTESAPKPNLRVCSSLGGKRYLSGSQGSLIKSTEELQFQRVAAEKKEMTDLKVKNSAALKRMNTVACLPPRPDSSKPPAGGKPKTCYKSALEQIRDFHLKTPQRFRTVPRDATTRSRTSSVCSDRSAGSTESAKLKPTSALPPKQPAPITQPKPFNLRIDQRGEIQQEKWKQKVGNEERKAVMAAQFHAKPVPSNVPFVPEKRPSSVTQPQPFNLKIDERGQLQQERLKDKRAEEDRLARERAHHHARPADVLKRKPFQPRKSDQHVTEPLKICLNSEKRAMERQQYDEQAAALETQRAVIHAERQRIKEELEREVERKARQASVIKPERITKYKPLVIHKSGKPLTRPLSPQIKHTKTKEDA